MAFSDWLLGTRQMCSMHFFNFSDSLMRQVHLPYPHGRWFLIIYGTHAVFLHMYLWLLSPTLSTYSFCTLYWERFLVNLNMILLCLLLLFQSLHAGLLHKLLLSLNPGCRDPYGRYEWICSFLYLFFHLFTTYWAFMYQAVKIQK